jgi:hypothetical protein
MPDASVLFKDPIVCFVCAALTGYGPGADAMEYEKAVKEVEMLLMQAYELEKPGPTH